MMTTETVILAIVAEDVETEVQRQLLAPSRGGGEQTVDRGGRKGSSEQVSLTQFDVAGCAGAPSPPVDVRLDVLRCSRLTLLIALLRLYVEGKSYQEIAERLDNALQRSQRKLEGHLQARAVADAG